MIICEDSARIFSPVELMYNKRAQIKKTDSTKAEVYKLWMNSLYGRFGMKAYEIVCTYPKKMMS